MAEVNIAIVGFATLVTIFREKVVNWKFTDRRNMIRFIMMVELALLNVIFSYIPMVIKLVFPSVSSFGVSSIIYGVFCSCYFPYVHSRNKRLAGKEQVSNINAIIIYTLSIIMIFYALSIGTGLLGPNHQGLYLFIMLYIIILEMYFFIGLIHYSIPQPPEMEK